MESLWDKIINTPTALSKINVDADRKTSCIYPVAFEGKAEIVRWFYSRNNGCQVFYGCSKSVSEKIDALSWAEVSYAFTVFVEQILFPFCVENTNWDRCYRYGIDYHKKVAKRDRVNCPDTGCSGTICSCEPFGEGDFTNGIAEDDEFDLSGSRLSVEQNKEL